MTTEKNCIFQINNLTKSYAGKHALNNVSLTVNQDEKIAIIGPSGSGKSTLLRCINLLEIPEGGEIFYSGGMIFSCKSKEIKNRIALSRSEGATPQQIEELTAQLKEQQLAEKALDKKMRRGVDLYRAKVGMVFQHFNLFPHLTVLQNITLAPVKLGFATKDEADERAVKLLKRISLLDKIMSYPSSLSGGQKQRLAIIRALALEPEVMLFDEPTSALDPEMVKEVLSFIREIKDEIHTMLIVTHEMNFAREVSSRILFMDGGQIVEDQPPAEFFKNPTKPRVIDFLEKVL